MNPSFAYFSTHQFANHAALNTSWNLMYDIKHYRRSNRNNYVFYNFKDSFGWCRDGQTVAFDNVSKKVILNTTPQFSEHKTSETVKDSQAFMQNISFKYTGF